MPFKETKEGTKIWQDPDGDRVDYFLHKLLDTAKKGEETLPSSIQGQLQSFLSATLTGVKRLANSNSKRSASLSNILRLGIQPVDIVLPVYGNLQIVQECIESVLNRTLWPYHLTIVDDCSPDAEVVPYLRSISKTYPEKISLIINSRNKGFAGSVNVGIKNTSGHYICILNSDVIVTPGWMEKMILALEANPKHQIVNPVTNNTALINVPMQEGFSYLDMNKALEISSSHIYQEIMPTGFCFLFRRDIIKQIGYLDEGFRKGYGEDTDWWMKVISHVKDGEYQRWKAILADDTYIFHERSTSFSSLGNDEYLSTRQSGSSRFHSIWPQFKQWQKSFNIQAAMAPFRTAMPTEYSQNRDAFYNIAFVVHSTAFCGGMKFISDIVNTCIEQNINAKIVHIKRDPKDKPIPLGELRVSPVLFDSPELFKEQFKEKVFKSGVVIAATCELAGYVAEVCKQPGTNLRSVLFAQSDDPKLAPSDELTNEMKVNARSVDYLISGSSIIERTFGKEYKKGSLFSVKPGVDTRLFHKRDRSKGDERPTVLFSLLQTYPFKGFNRGVAAAQALLSFCEKNGKDIRVMAYGVQSVSHCPNIICMGSVTQSYLANLLGTEVDIFCDPSSIHSYGLPALEAMASGVVPVMWDNGGIREYATDKKNAIILSNDSNPTLLASWMYKLIFEEPEILNSLKMEAAKVSQIRSNAVNFFINSLESKLNLKAKPRKIAVITPHLRKHGGPTTILHMANHLQKRGHKIELYTVYPDINPEVVESSQVPINVNWKNMDSCDVLITNSDNDKNDFFSSCKKAKKKVMLKLSHNPRFKELEDQGLAYPWDAIVTSTQWLADICQNPQDGWNYKPVSATRIGWYHYGHEKFNCPPNVRKYGTVQNTLRIGFLAHQHPSKGTQEALQALFPIKQKHGKNVEIIAIGEWPQFAQSKPNWIKYVMSPNRDQMAETLRQIDIWVTASHTEGLGRMALEAMSSSCAVIMTDTGAEFADPGKNCLVVGKMNVPQIIRSIEKLMDSPELFTEIVKNGYETACRYADPENYIANLDRVINDVCER